MAVAMTACSTLEQPKDSQHILKLLPSHYALAVKKVMPAIKYQ